jgi:Icc-related predicted phosphoesterase
MKICCISDLHGYFPEIEPCDLLLIAGDLTSDQSEEALHEAIDWMESVDCKRVIYIAGNHDNQLENCPPHIWPCYNWPPNQSKYKTVEYLCDSGTEFEGLKIWGSPWSLRFAGMNPKCSAFTGTEEELDAFYALIPDDTDILITHGPSFGVLDKDLNDQYLGSNSLRTRMMGINHKLHVFGHIHESYGQIDFISSKSINASHVNRAYEPVNKPIYLEI